MALENKNIINISYSSNCSVMTVASRYQWDKGVILHIAGLTADKRTFLHCSHEGQRYPAYVLTTKYENGMLIALIPDELFQQTEQIRCYLYVETSNSGTTVFEIRVPIIPRSKPSDYIFDPLEAIPEGTGGGMPEGGAPYQQLVTDGEGKTVWVDRLAYEDPNTMDYILLETELINSEDGFVYPQPLGRTLKADESCIITYNGTPYTCTAVDMAEVMQVPGAVAFGNVGLIIGDKETGEPFILVVISDEATAMMGVSAICMALDGAASVSISIAKALIKKIDPKLLPEGIGYVADGVVHTIPAKYLPSNEPMKLYIQERDFTEAASLQVDRDDACTEPCTSAEFKELEAGRPFVVCVYYDGWYGYVECPPSAYKILPMGFSAFDSIGVVLSYVYGAAAKTRMVYLRFAD